MRQESVDFRHGGPPLADDGWMGAATVQRHVGFCKTDSGARIAYARVGTGPPLVVPPAWISHIELYWQDPLFRAFYAPIVAHRSLVYYDFPGCGLSDPWPTEQREPELTALATVVDELGLERFALLGVCMGAPVAVSYATLHPQRVERLVLYGGYADGTRVASPQVRAALRDVILANWGLGTGLLADLFMPDANAAGREQAVRLQRGSASAERACQLLERCYDLDVTELLEQVTTPTLVLHRRDDRAMPYELGRELAAGIPGARLVTLDGRSHFPYVGDAQSIVRLILEFLGAPLPPSRPVSLTKRQREVAALVAEGLTNRQIAERLNIEERSAEGHLERIRLRLGFTTRSQIAAWWTQQLG